MPVFPTRGSGPGVVLLFLCFTLMMNFCSGYGTQFQVLDASGFSLLSGTASTSDPISNAVHLGLSTALPFTNVNYSNTITLVPITNYGSNLGLALVSALQANSNIVSVIGVVGDENFNTVLEAVSSKSIPIFSPIVGGVPAAKWNPLVVFTMMRPQDELALLVKYAYVNCRARRIGFMYTTGVGVGDELYPIAQAYLANISAASSLIEYVQENSAYFSTSQFASFVSNYPSATIIQSKPGSVLQTFALNYMDAPETAGTNLLASTYQQADLVSVFTKYTGNNPVTLTIASSIPPLKGSPYNAPTTVKVAVPTVTDANFIYVFHAYSSMFALSYAVQWVTTAAELYQNLFTYYTRFLFDDYVMGFYGPTYVESIVSQGGFAECNHGGQRVWLQQFSTAGLATPVENYTNLEATCGIQGSIPTQTSMVVISYSDPVLAAVYAESVPSQGLSLPVSGLIAGPLDTKPNSLTTSHQTSVVAVDSSAFANEVQRYLVDVIYGPFDPELTPLPSGVILWDPIYATPQVNMRRENEFHIVPTFTEDIILFCSSLEAISTPGNTMISAVIRANKTQAFLMQEAVMAIGSGVYGFSTYVDTVTDEEPITAAMWNTGYNILVGMTANEIPSVNAYLKENTKVSIFIPYRQMSLLFSALKTNITSDLYERVYSSSNIPFWNSGETPLQAEMSAAVDLLRRNPFRLMNTTYTLASGLPLDIKGELSAGSLTVGPFYSAGWVNPANGKIDAAGRNWGAKNVSFMTAATFLANTTVPVTSFSPDGNLYMFPSYDPFNPENSTTTTSSPITIVSDKNHHNASIVLIIFIVVSIALFLVILGYILYLTVLAWLFVKNAPRDQNKEITVIYSDVDFSAALWSELPHLQEWASSEHEQIIRDLIDKYKCYEAYSDGSRFVIVSKDAHNGLLLSCAIHQSILEHEWNSEKFDEWYQLIEEALKMEDYTNYTLELTLEEYEELWGGLRVRISVHSGLCGIHFQQSTKKYQYFGSTVETASHVEEKTQGGATIATEATWELLTATQTAGIDHSYLGLVDIRGTPHPLRLYLINAIPGRAFGPLHTPPRYLQASAHSDDKETEFLKIQTSLLSLVYGHFPIDQRVEEILPLAQAWGVTIPPQEESDEEYCKILIELILNEMSDESGDQEKIENDRPDSDGDYNSEKRSTRRSTQGRKKSSSFVA